MSDDETLRIFAGLVMWWEDSEEARYALEQFQREYREPRPPKNPIASVAELINYNRQKWQYEQELENLARNHEQISGGVKEWADLVRHLLPEGGVLTYNYQGPNTQFVGTTYTISHTPGEHRQPSEIRVEKRGHPPR